MPRAASTPLRHPDDSPIRALADDETDESSTELLGTALNELLSVALRHEHQGEVAAAGGDDLVTKPLSRKEVVTRLHALMGDAAVVADPSTSVLSVGDLALDENSHHVTRDGAQIALTATEFDLLRYLMRNAKRVLSKAQILDRVWDYDFSGHSNVVELYISYLRKKIDVGRAPMIHTVRGVGYVIRPAG